LARGPWIPKRLVEAWVGAQVNAIVPTAHLWAPTYRLRDGFGLHSSPGLYLIQCFPVEDRKRGFSTKVSRRMLATYLEDANLGSWGSQTRLVLVGQSTAPADAGASGGVKLWVARPPDLAEVTDHQERGTINAKALQELVDEGYAETPSIFLRHVASGPMADRHSSCSRLEPLGWHSLRREPFGMHRPTPLGLALDDAT
jgi:hypothetical protein